jgi:glutamine amidotransferase/cyclase
MTSLKTTGLLEPLRQYIRSGKPYFGICIGMQALFEESDESPDIAGLGIVPGKVSKFNAHDPEAEGGSGLKSVPHMGWNGASRAWTEPEGRESLIVDGEDFYFVHSFRALFKDSTSTQSPETNPLAPYVHTLSRYGSEEFVSTIRLGNVFGTQFHPEKSGPAGLEVLRRWLEASAESLSGTVDPAEVPKRQKWITDDDTQRRKRRGLTKRIVACLDVRSNDQGDLVVTKGDQYDVREKADDEAGKGDVRNLGKPVDLARRYYHESADEICFLNITSFRNSALQDQPMLKVVEAAAETVFVPLTVGGGIKDTTDPDGTVHSALEVAGAYFRAGADKVSIGSEAVIAVEEMLQREARGEKAMTGKTGIETIAYGYGSQAVVVSIDPKRVYFDTSDPEWQSKVPTQHLPCVIVGDHATSSTREEERGKAWWYQCTIRGGREVRDIDVIQLAQGVEKLGAGEILLNSVDRDGSGKGFDLDLINLVKKSVSIPVVASSGAGKVEDFSELFRETGVEAGLAAGIFHRREVPLDDVKAHLKAEKVPVRITSLPTVT